MSKNIMHLISSLNYGGAEKVVYDLSSNATENFNVHVYTINLKGDMSPLFNDINVTTNFNENPKGIIGFVSSVSKLYNYVTDNNIKLVHCHMLFAILVASIVKLFKPSLKIVFTLHSISLPMIWMEILVFLLIPFRNVDIKFSSIEKKRFYDRSDYIVIPNGVNIREFVPLNMDKYDLFTFICIGGLRPAKNYVGFIKEVAKYNFKFEYQILIAGKGPLEQEIVETINECFLMNNIKLLGLRTDISELLSKSHVFLMPSIKEGFPISLLEAAAQKTPVIVTPVGSVPSLITKENGTMVKLEKFCQEMELIHDNYEAACYKADELYNKVVSEYSIESVLRKHESVYMNLLES